MLLDITGIQGQPMILIWIEVSEENSERAMAAIRKFGFSQNEISKDLFLKSDQILRMGVPPLRIEVLTGVSGIDFQSSYNEHVAADFNGLVVNVISLAQLKKTRRRLAGLKI
jgi:hypothetical protein